MVSFNDVDNLIREHEVGVVCSGIDDMEATIRELLGDEARLHGMSERAHRLVRERFSPEVLGSQYAAFFEELLAGRGTR